MTNSLLKAMSADMGIIRYKYESNESFAYRLCYSALGQWCLSTAMNSSDNITGTTKHNQTIVLNDLMSRYCELFPQITSRLIDLSNRLNNFSVSIRRAYEETGYLLTDSNSHNKIANYGRAVQIGNKFLFFGLPDGSYEVNGLGVFTNTADNFINVKDFLIRDSLSSEEYFNTRFDSMDFGERDIDLSELEFFNPKSKNVPSRSWVKKPETDCTVARKKETCPYYLIMDITDNIQFANESIYHQNDIFSSY